MPAQVNAESTGSTWLTGQTLWDANAETSFHPLSACGSPVGTLVSAGMFNVLREEAFGWSQSVAASPQQVLFGYVRPGIKQPTDSRVWPLTLWAFVNSMRHVKAQQTLMGSCTP